jgi:hypothetical protein
MFITLLLLITLVEQAMITQNHMFDKEQSASGL